MGYKSSSYYFMIFIVISVSFLSFIPILKKRLAQTGEEILYAHMRIAQADILEEKVKGNSINKVCTVNPDVLFVEYLAAQTVDGFVCRDSHTTFVLGVKSGEKWYCVDSEGFDGYVGENSINETCTS